MNNIGFNIGLILLFHGVCNHIAICSADNDTNTDDHYLYYDDFEDYQDYLDHLDKQWSNKSAKPCREDYTLARMICLPWNYSGEYRPEDITDVSFVFHVDDIPEINDEKQTIYMTMYLSMKWREPRIRVLKGAKNQTVLNSAKGRSNLWFPDLAMENLVNFKIKNTLYPIEGITIHKGNSEKYTHSNVLLTI